MNVLLVDDDVDLRDCVMSALTDAGFSVSTASSGGEAADLLAACAPDAVITDLRMPGDGGRRVLAAAHARSVPCIVYTGSFADSAVDAPSAAMMFVKGHDDIETMAAAVRLLVETARLDR